MSEDTWEARMSGSMADVSELVEDLWTLIRGLPVEVRDMESDLVWKEKKVNVRWSEIGSDIVSEVRGYFRGRVRPTEVIVMEFG
jgi:hypothetical protein